jgi:hypothetical protein
MWALASEFRFFPNVPTRAVTRVPRGPGQPGSALMTDCCSTSLFGILDKAGSPILQKSSFILYAFQVVQLSVIQE